MIKKYIVRLTDEERTICESTIKDEKGKSEKLRRAAILLRSDANGQAWNDAKISEAVGCRRERSRTCGRHSFSKASRQRWFVRNGRFRRRRNCSMEPPRRS